MKIYKISQIENEGLFASYTGEQKELAIEAIKSNSFEGFKKKYLIEFKRGIYWHVTDDPNFTIDRQRGPRDMSSMANGEETVGSLMVTSDLELWAEHYEDRKYAAQIDLSLVPDREFYQVNRGFGNEFWIEDASKARVKKVFPIKEALYYDENINKNLPSSENELRQFYENVVRQIGK